MNREDTGATPKMFVVIAILIVVGIAADVADVVVYRMHTARHGIGWFDMVPWAVTWEYLSSLTGACLTLLAFAPWLVLLGWLHFGKP